IAIVVGDGVMTALTAWKSSYAILGRDPGIYQYVAWAIAKGQRDYIDIREFNGPLIHIVHGLFLRLGGADEHVFRLIHLPLSSLVFVATGALLTRRGRVVWAGAAWVVLMSQYVQFGWWQTAQREAFYNWFLLPAIGLQLFAQAPGGRARRWPFALAGALGALTWFGKPT